MAQDDFGNRIKSYEKADSINLNCDLPIVVRLDGRAFSNFTNGLQRPFDLRFTNLMIETAIFVTKETQARVGYTQSDEISLLLYHPDELSTPIFGGKQQKLVSNVSSLATAFFNYNRKTFLPDYKPEEFAIFDCRAFNVPSTTEATNTILWRVFDAQRNAVSMAARAKFSHKTLQYKSTLEMLKMLDSTGEPFNSNPSSFRFGTFVNKKGILDLKHSSFKSFSAAERESIVINGTSPQ